MKIGVVFPQTEIGTDPGAVKEYVQTADALGYDHMIVYDHVLGADTNYHTNLQGMYTLEDRFLESFVLFGYVAALTTKIQLTTGILILPQRQTALVAKQAATLDILSQGRLRLGIGIGWNYVEYEALNESFGNRGRRSAEQIDLLRMLWTNDKVNFEGKWHRITHAGIRPLPVQRPIPIWLGGGSEQVFRRIGRIGDGWIATVRDTGLDDDFRAKIAKIHDYAREAGRDPGDIGIEGFFDANRPVEELVKATEKWKSFGATHVSIQTMRCGLKSPKEHIKMIRDFKEALG